MDQPITIAKIGRYRGKFGEVFIHPTFDLTREQIKNVPAVVRQASGEEIGTTLEKIWWHGKKAICKLGCANNISEARNLVHAMIIIDRSALAETDDDEFYTDDLIGLTVETTDGKKIGTVEQFLDFGESMLMKVKGQHEVLVPFNEAIIDSVDLESGVIIIDPPEGLLEINEV